MKTEWSDENQDVMDQNDSLDLYNDEMARSAVGSLFDDEDAVKTDEKPISASGRYVTGFDKPPESKPPARVHIPEPDPPEQMDEPDIYEEPEPDPAPISRRRNPIRESNPAPRPAVRAAQTHSRSRLTPSRSKSMETEENLSDEYDAFRQRYKNHEAVPTPRPQVERLEKPERVQKFEKERPERERVERVEREKPERVKPRLNRQSSPSLSEFDDPPPVPTLRWAGIAIVAVVLIIMAFLVFRITSLSSQLKDATEVSENGVISDSRETELLLEIEEKDKRIQSLEQQLEQYTAPGLPQVTWQPLPGEDGFEETDPGEGSARPTDADEPPSITSTGGDQFEIYVVVSGDSLSRIASRMYNSTQPAAIQRIRDANGLTTDTLSIGQELRIPRD